MLQPGLLNRKAPNFLGLEGWINSEPLTVHDLRGKIILLDFWTYSCVNCLRALRHVKEFHVKYGGNDFQVIGVHTPEFDFERIKANVEKAVQKRGVKYPIALDSQNQTWRLYGNRYWPRLTIVDAEGLVRYEHAGEGDASQLERNIVTLLREKGVQTPDPGSDDDFESFVRSIEFSLMTPELYTGSQRSSGFGNAGVCTPGTCNKFSDSAVHEKDIVYLEGEWVQERERIHHPTNEKAGVRLKYTARSVTVVLYPYSGRAYDVTVRLDGLFLSSRNQGSDISVDSERRSIVRVDFPDAYEIVDTKTLETHELELCSDSPDFTLYTFTFG